LFDDDSIQLLRRRFFVNHAIKFPHSYQHFLNLKPYKHSLPILGRPFHAKHVCNPASQAYIVAPPDSIASISALVHGVRWYLLGSSLRSKFTPLPGSIGPRDAPEWLPMELEYVVFSGPCCCAFFLYEANEFGRGSGAAGCVCGVWSSSKIGGLVSGSMDLGMTETHWLEELVYR
jgi:hypothetical protein